MWVTVEGINGVGKTYLVAELSRRLGVRAGLISELTDPSTADGVRSRVMAALTRPGDLFLRGGFPMAETFALAGLKVRDREDMTGHPLPPVVIEDRGMDTVVVYQAAILAGEAATDADLDAWATKVRAVAARWRPPPDLTLLVTDDVERCIARVEQRERRALRPDERALVMTVDRVYRRLAADEPDRVVVVDRSGCDADDVVSEMAGRCLARLDNEAVP